MFGINMLQNRQTRRRKAESNEREKTQKYFFLSSKTKRKREMEPVKALIEGLISFHPLHGDENVLERTRKRRHEDLLADKAICVGETRTETR